MSFEVLSKDMSLISYCTFTHTVRVETFILLKLFLNQKDLISLNFAFDIETN